MHYQILPNGKTFSLNVFDGNGAYVTAADAGDMKAAHALIKQARADGWQSITPEALAAQTKAEAAKEKARVEAGKKAAEPKAK